MNTFSTRNLSVAVVPVNRGAVWEVLVEPDLLADFTPLIDTIEAEGDIWTWRLTGISGLGLTVAPSFTEQMTFIAPSRLDFHHVPPDGSTERAGANGTYVLTELGPRLSRLEIDITVCVELPLPQLSRAPVERIMAVTADRAGDTFANRLYDHLGIDPDDPNLRVTKGAGA